MLFTPNGRTLYAATYGSVVPIRTATNTAGKPIAIAANGSTVTIALSPDGRTLYAASSGAGTVTPIRTATNKLGKPIALGGQAYGLVISPRGRTAYAGVILGASGPWAVIPVNIAAGKARAPITPMGQVAYMVLTLDGKILYVVHQDTSTVTPIRTATRTMLPDIKAGDFPDGVAITPNGRTVYVLNGASNTLTRSAPPPARPTRRSSSPARRLRSPSGDNNPPAAGRGPDLVCGPRPWMVVADQSTQVAALTWSGSPAGGTPNQPSGRQQRPRTCI